MSPQYTSVFKSASGPSAFQYQDMRIGNNDRESMNLLFLPGHMGDHKQVRSLGSSGLRAKQFGAVRALEFFEAPSVFLPCATHHQAQFAASILDNMRTASTASRDTLLIGHSMGAHAVLLAAAPNRTANETVQVGPHSSTTVMLLASPLRAPAVGLSSCSWRAHDTLRFHARQLRALPNRDVTVVSLDGGDRDLLVDPRSARLDDLIEDHVSLGDPRLQFAGVDHRAILWCRQVVDGLVQGLAGWRQGRGQKGQAEQSLGEHIRQGIGREAQMSS